MSEDKDIQISTLKVKIDTLKKENSELKKLVITMRLKLERYEEFLGVNKNA